jgi:hypothetical protein
MMSVALPSASSRDNAPQQSGPTKACPHWGAMAQTVAKKCPHYGKPYRERTVPRIFVGLAECSAVVIGGRTALLGSVAHQVTTIRPPIVCECLSPVSQPM